MNSKCSFWFEQQLSAISRQLTKNFISIAVQLPTIAVHKKLLTNFATFFLTYSDVRLVSACTAAAAAVRQALAPKAAKKPVLLMGDFNSTPTSAAIKALKEDFAVLSDETKFTWNAKAPDRTIDYIFVDKAHAEDYRAVSRKVEAHPEATDHCALSVSLEKCR